MLSHYLEIKFHFHFKCGSQREILVTKKGNGHEQIDNDIKKLRR